MILYIFHPLFSFIFNEEVAGYLFVPAVLMSIGFYISGTTRIPDVFALAVGNSGIMARQQFYDLLLIVPVMVFLIAKLQLVGAGLSLIVMHVFHLGYGVRRVCIECLKLPLLSWYGHVARILLLAVGTYGIGWLVMAPVLDRGFTMLMTGYVVASVLFFGGSWFIITGELKSRILRGLVALKS